MNKFCPDAPKDFIAKLALLIKHIKENYDKTEFDLWEEPSESYSLDSVKHDFAIVCSNFFISDDTMIEYFDEYLSKRVSLPKHGLGCSHVVYFVWNHYGVHPPAVSFFA